MRKETDFKENCLFLSVSLSLSRSLSSLSYSLPTPSTYKHTQIENVIPEYICVNNNQN